MPPTNTPTNVPPTNYPDRHPHPTPVRADLGIRIIEAPIDVELSDFIQLDVDAQNLGPNPGVNVRLTSTIRRS